MRHVSLASKLWKIIEKIVVNGITRMLEERECVQTSNERASDLTYQRFNDL